MPTSVAEQLPHNRYKLINYVFPGEVLRIDRVNSVRNFAKTVIICCSRDDTSTEIFEFDTVEDPEEAARTDSLLEKCTPETSQGNISHEDELVLVMTDVDGEQYKIIVDHRLTMGQN